MEYLVKDYTHYNQDNQDNQEVSFEVIKGNEIFDVIDQAKELKRKISISEVGICVLDWS